MIDRPDPFPDLPNPLKQGTPMPHDWQPADVSPDDGSEHEFLDFEASQVKLQRKELEQKEILERKRKQRENLMEDIHPGDKSIKNKLDDLFDGQAYKRLQ